MYNQTMNDDALTVDITQRTPSTDWRTRRHSPEVKELAMACWFDADGNCAKAHRLLMQACMEDTSGRFPSDRSELPSVDAIRRWARNDGWEARLTQAVADDYPASYHYMTARIIRLGPQALDRLDDLTSPDYVPEKGDFLKNDAAKFLVAILGLGTAGQRDGQASLSTKQETTIDVSTLTPNELARYQRQHLTSGTHHSTRDQQRSARNQPARG